MPVSMAVTVTPLVHPTAKMIRVTYKTELVLRVNLGGPK